MIDLTKRVYAQDAQKLNEGDSIVIAGWAENVKNLGKIAFVHVRDRTGKMQATAFPDNKYFKDIEAIPKESVVVVSGKLAASKLKSGDKELHLDAIDVLSKAEPIPLDISGKIDSNLDTRLDHRVVDLRNPKNMAVFKFRSKVNAALRKFMIAEGFIEIQTSKLIGAGAEGGATLFSLDYYGKTAYLSQSQQLYKQAVLSSGFDKVFEIGPSFRAEKSHTTRHLAEFTHFDFEMAWINDYDDVLKVLERMFVAVCKEVKKTAKDELEILGVTIAVPKLPFPRVRYADAVKLLGEAGKQIPDGEDLGTEDEKLLGQLVKKKYKNEAYFITEWPYSIKPFYIMTDGEVSKGFDFEYRGVELSSGGQREHRHDVLKSQIAGKGLKVEDFGFYLEPFKYGMPPHGGFGMGVDRLVQMLLGLPNIREAVMFPRDPERLSP